MYFVQKIFSETVSKKTTEGSVASEGALTPPSPALMSVGVFLRDYLPEIFSNARNTSSGTAKTIVLESSEEISLMD